MTQPLPILSNPKICLAMIVRDESSIIERCLLAARPFISQWLIHDLGSQDDTQDIITTSLADIPGKLESHTFKNFTLARNKLLRSALKEADLVLMLDADEELHCFNSQINLAPNAQVGLVDIKQAHFTTRQARLFRSSSGKTPLRFTFPVHETLQFENFNFANVSGLSLKHHSDGVRHRKNDQKNIDQLLLASELLDNKESPKLHLAIAQNALKLGDIESALKHFLLVKKFNGSKNDTWLANYLAANIYISQNDPDNAVQFFEFCLALDADRIEPIVRLAELKLSHDEFDAAFQLCKLVVDLPIPPQADYFEPGCYQYTTRMLLAETALRIGETDTAKSALKPLFNNHSLPNGISTRYSQLRDRVFNIEKPTSNKPAKTPKNGNKKPKLTIGMATFDDYDGVYFSVMSLILYHTDIINDVEILIVDNNPSSDHGKAVQSLCTRVDQAKYVEAGEYQGTTIRERVFAEASSDFVVCMDCHVFLHAGAVSRLIDYFETNPNSTDLIHGPLFYDNHQDYSTHMKPEWNSGFYGVWGKDPRASQLDNSPFEIPLQGMGLFACVRKNWRGFSQKFRGFGGEEGYIHEKFRQHGGQVLCLPFLRWTHRFDRPNGVKYTNKWEDRIRNYLIGWSELGLDINPVLQHFYDRVGQDITATSYAQFCTEIRGPLWEFSSVASLVKNDQEWLGLQTSLNNLTANNITLRLNTAEEAAKLIRFALEKGDESILFINGTTNWQAANVRVDLVKATDSQMNVVIGSAFTLVKQKAFNAAANCYSQYGELSPNSFEQTDNSVSILNLRQGEAKHTDLDQ